MINRSGIYGVFAYDRIVSDGSLSRFIMKLNDHRLTGGTYSLRIYCNATNTAYYYNAELNQIYPGIKHPTMAYYSFGYYVVRTELYTLTNSYKFYVDVSMVIIVVIVIISG